MKGNVELTPNGQTLVWTISENTLETLEPGSEFTITFKAKIKKDAVIDAEEKGIPNDAQLDFDNNRGWHTEPKGDEPPPTEPPVTPPVTVDPDEGKLTIIKTSRETDERLAGAEFELQDLDGNIIDTTNLGNVIKVNGEVFNGELKNLVTDEKGEIVIDGLTPGEYLLKETKAPTYVDPDTGEEKPYRILTDPIKIKVKAKDIDESNVGTIVETDITVKNSINGWNLPTTGGIGTLIFTLVGLLLMATAAIAVIRRRQTVNN